MSDQTKQAMDEAIAAHYADEMNDAIVSAYVLQVVGGSIEDYDHGQQSYFRCIQEGQAFLSTLGLAHYLHTNLTAAAASSDD